MQVLERVPIIAIDGNHRSGKGTQIKLLETTLLEKHKRPYILRGDGSRPGLGNSEGDPCSEWWQDFTTYIKKFENEYNAWRIGARKLLAEAAIKYANLVANSDAVIIFDRSYLSRTQITLKEGLDPTFKNMYRNVDSDSLKDEVIDSLTPDLTIYLDTPSNILVKRLIPGDPKYEFRYNNIINSSQYFEEAFVNLEEHGNSIIRVNGDQGPRSIEKIIMNAIIDRDIIN